jgi:hypothetical protein
LQFIEQITDKYREAVIETYAINNVWDEYVSVCYRSYVKYSELGKI